MNRGGQCGQTLVVAVVSGRLSRRGSCQIPDKPSGLFCEFATLATPFRKHVSGGLAFVSDRCAE